MSFELDLDERVKKAQEDEEEEKRKRKQQKKEKKEEDKKNNEGETESAAPAENELDMAALGLPTGFNSSNPNRK